MQAHSVYVLMIIFYRFTVSCFSMEVLQIHDCRIVIMVFAAETKRAFIGMDGRHHRIEEERRHVNLAPDRLPLVQRVVAYAAAAKVALLFPKLIAVDLSAVS